MFYSLFQNKRRKLAQQVTRLVMIQDTINFDRLVSRLEQKIQVYGQEIFWNRITLIKTN